MNNELKILLKNHIDINEFLKTVSFENPKRLELMDAMVANLFEIQKNIGDSNIKLVIDTLMFGVNYTKF